MPRAVECARRGAVLNGLSDFTAEVADDGRALPRASFDLVLANPPYYSQERIAALWDEHRMLRAQERFGNRDEIIKRARHEERLARAA